MFISIVSKNGKRIADRDWDSYTTAFDECGNREVVFDSKEQYERFCDWAFEDVQYEEAKARVEKLGYKVWEGDSEFGQEIPKTLPRFSIWRRVDKGIRRPEIVDFEGIKLSIKVS